MGFFKKPVKKYVQLGLLLLTILFLTIAESTVDQLFGDGDGKVSFQGFDTFIVSSQIIFWGLLFWSSVGFLGSESRKKVFFYIYLFSVIVCIFLGLEWITKVFNKKNNIELPFFINSREPAFQTTLNSFQFNHLDPHLGYAHTPGAKDNVEIKSPHIYRSGFVAFTDKKKLDSSRPIIVTLGGSTTDSLQFEDSWPEALSNILKSKDIPWTVVNGGVGGHSTSQELIKLLRDAIELNPYLVIAYNGINDLNNWSKLPYPMIHPYQDRILNFVVNQNLGRSQMYLPNLLYFFKNALNPELAARSVHSIERGLKTTKSTGEFYLRNHELMYAICSSQGIKYLGVLQPVIGIGRNDTTGVYPRNTQYFKGPKGDLYTCNGSM